MLEMTIDAKEASTLADLLELAAESRLCGAQELYRISRFVARLRRGGSVALKTITIWTADADAALHDCLRELDGVERRPTQKGEWMATAMAKRGWICSGRAADRRVAELRIRNRHGIGGWFWQPGSQR